MITLTNSYMYVDQVNTTITTESLPENEIDAYLGTTCGRNAQCGKDNNGKGLNGYEESYNENVTIWMVCLGNTTWNTNLNVTALYLRNYTEPVSDSSESGLSKGGIAGIVIACVVAFLFIVGLLISLKGTAGIKSLCKCCLNKTQSLPDDSPRQEVERKETGLAGDKEIAHQPSNQVSIQPSPAKDLTRQPLSGLLEDQLGSSAHNGFGHDLNATGQNLLGNAKQSHENGPHIGAAAGTTYNSNGSPKGSSHLPNINVDKIPAAKEWAHLDQEQHLSDPNSQRFGESENGKLADSKRGQ